MATWTTDELHEIAATEELELASLRRDGTLSNAVTIWVVRVVDDLYVRSWKGGLDVEGLAKGFAPLELVTPQLAPAVDGADVIIVVTGSHFHADVARSLAGVLRDGQSILLIQGGTGGSLLVRRELRAAGCRAAVDVSEMDNYPYSLGWPEPTRS